MKIKLARTSTFALTLLLGNHQANCQGAFQNLDFESANLSPVPSGQFGGEVSSIDAIPGWTCFLGTTQITQVFQNNYTLGNASIDILGPNWNFGGIIEGQYTVVLQPGRDPNGGTFPSNVGASLSQIGLVPVGSASIQFKASTFSSFSVSLGGQNLSLIPLGTGANYTLYGADISSLAGQTETLTISAQAASNTTDYFDSIIFSVSPVPEPGTLALFATGALFFARRRRQNFVP